MIPDRTPSPNSDLLDLDCLVFSSHKTATQTIKASLRSRGLTVAHCHNLENLGMKDGQFAPYLREFLSRNGRKPVLVSVFRDPYDRMVSSFFQSLSRDYHAWTRPDSDHWGKDLDGFDRSLPEMQRLFIRYARIVDGWGESIDIICRETGINIAEFSYSDEDRYGTFENEALKLLLFRYDRLVPDFAPLRTALRIPDLRIDKRNLAERKRYHDLYLRFRAEARMPRSVIFGIYARRAHLMQLFYGGDAAAVRRRALRDHAAA